MDELTEVLEAASRLVVTFARHPRPRWLSANAGRLRTVRDWLNDLTRALKETK